MLTDTLIRMYGLKVTAIHKNGIIEKEGSLNINSSIIGINDHSLFGLETNRSVINVILTSSA